MITIPKKKCSITNCKTLIDIRKDYCEEHKEFNYDNQRYKNDKEVRRTYNNSQWKSVRKATLMRDDYMCMYCMANGNGNMVKAEVVDHFMPIRDSYDDRYDMNNLVSACTSCNTLKYYDEVKLRNGSMTIEMYKEKWKYTINE